ncbi:MAG: hypothetical protein KKA60_05365, partial [Proteobacteria bacterium]|nr:hypothetical protein [Pseudomonadota bacterium]
LFILSHRLAVFCTVIPAKAGIQEKERAFLESRNSNTGNDLLHQTGQIGSLLSSLDSGLRRNDGFQHGFPFPEFLEEPFSKGGTPPGPCCGKTLFLTTKKDRPNDRLF